MFRPFVLRCNHYTPKLHAHVHPSRLRLNSTADAKTTNLLQNGLDFGIQLTLSVLLAGICVKVLLDLSHAGVGLGAEAELDLYQSLEAGIEVGDTEVDELRELGEQLVVELLVRGLGQLGVLLSTGKLGDVLVRLLDELLDLGAHGVVVEELVVALLDA